MKSNLRFLFIAAIITAVSSIAGAQTLGQKGFGGSVGGGITLGVSQGASYKNPSFGGYGRVYFSAGRFDIRDVFSVEHDQKVFEPDGTTVHNRVLAGVLIGKYIRPVGGLNFVRHTNSEYTKSGVAAGGGLMFVLTSKNGQTLSEPYLLFFVPDSSPNKVQKSCFGVEITQRFKERLELYIGGELSRIIFDQPFAGPEVIHGLTASGFRVWVGVALPFGKSR